MYDAIMRARYFPATTAKLPAIDNYANYAIKLFIQAPDLRDYVNRSASSTSLREVLPSNV